MSSETGVITESKSTNSYYIFFLLLIRLNCISKTYSLTISIVFWFPFIWDDVKTTQEQRLADISFFWKREREREEKTADNNESLSTHHITLSRAPLLLSLLSLSIWDFSDSVQLLRKCICLQGKEYSGNLLRCCLHHTFTIVRQ